MTTQAEIARRQNKASELNKRLLVTIQSDSRLSNQTALLLWHGSLVKGRGGEIYDFDYAIFADHDHCDNLLEYAKYLSEHVEHQIDDLMWRRDVHFDGFHMFEAHTHWDLRESGWPHVGVHVCSARALDELVGQQLWSKECGFVRGIDAWTRYGNLLRNWVYEGVPVYDADSIWESLTRLPVRPPDWMFRELRAVVRAGCTYRPQEDGHRSCTDGDPNLQHFIALLAYAIEGMPPGRKKRHADDIAAMCNHEAQSFLRAAVESDFRRVSELLGANSD